MFPAPAGFSSLQAFVPLDDDHTMLYFFQSGDAPMSPESRVKRTMRSGLHPGRDVDADYRNVRNAANRWQQDRSAMRRGESFTGISGVNVEDIAVQESMGPVYDRRKEHLGTSDVAVIRMRRIMLDGVKAFEAGAPPPGLAQPVDYREIRPVERMLPHGAAWQDLFAGQPA